MVGNLWRTFSSLVLIELNKGGGSEYLIIYKSTQKLIRLKLNIFAPSLIKKRAIKHKS